MRLFIAIPLPAAARRSLGALQAALAGAQPGPDVKWVEPDKLHLTLKFLGERPDPEVAAIRDALADAARASPRFRVALGPTGGFPSMAAPRVVWVGLAEGEGPVSALAGRIDAAGRRLGWPAEDRPFSAHLTIGRVRSPRGRAMLVRALREARWQPPAPWECGVVGLYRSQLSPSGPRYTALAELPLEDRH